jgi:hypothetical protein
MTPTGSGYWGAAAIAGMHRFRQCSVSPDRTRCPDGPHRRSFPFRLFLLGFLSWACKYRTTVLYVGLYLLPPEDARHRVDSTDSQSPCSIGQAMRPAAFWRNKATSRSTGVSPAPSDRRAGGTLALWRRRVSAEQSQRLGWRLACPCRPQRRAPVRAPDCAFWRNKATGRSAGIGPVLTDRRAGETPALRWRRALAEQSQRRIFAATLCKRRIFVRETCVAWSVRQPFRQNETPIFLQANSGAC